MIRRIFLAVCLVVAGILALSSCGGNGNQGSIAASDSADSSQDATGDIAEASEASKGDFMLSGLYVKEGKLYAFDASTGRAIARPGDEIVVMCALAPQETMVWYATQNSGTLTLWESDFDIDTQEFAPSRELCTLEQASMENIRGSYAEGQADFYSNMYYAILGDEGVLVVPCEFSAEWGDFMKAEVYSLNKQRLTTVATDFGVARSPEFKDFTPLVGAQGEGIPNEDELEGAEELYSTAKGVLMYRKTPVSDQLPIDRGSNLRFVDPQFSNSYDADSRKISFKVFTSFEDVARGALCIADTDGQYQQLLDPEGVSMRMRPVFSGEVLIYAKLGESSKGQGTVDLMATAQKDNSPLLISEDVPTYCVHEY